MVIKAGLDVTDKEEFPYEVYHEESDIPPDKFKTWKAAVMWQKYWNKDVKGHRARKRR